MQLISLNVDQIQRDFAMDMSHSTAPSIVVGGTILESGSKKATIGIILKYKDRLYLVTAGHAVEGVVGAPTSQERLGPVLVNTYRDNGKGDIAIVRIAKDQEKRCLPDKVLMGGIQTINISTTVVMGEDVMMLGGISQPTSGKISTDLADINTPDKDNVTWVHVATYPSVEGDSGSPIITIDKTHKSLHLIGIHGGRIKKKDQTHPYFTPISIVQSLIDEASTMV